MQIPPSSLTVRVLCVQWNQQLTNVTRLEVELRGAREQRDEAQSEVATRAKPTA